MRVRGRVATVLLLLFLAPGIVLTLVRLLDPWGGSWVRLESFTPVGIVVYGAALVVLLVRFARARRWGRGIAAAAVALGLALHIGWFAPMVSGANPPPRDGAEPLRVMVANLDLGEADGPSVVRVASQEQIDVLVALEVTPRMLDAMERAGLDSLFGHRAGRAAAGVRGTMVFASTPLGRATRVPTSWGSWQVPMGDHTLFAAHPHDPTDIGRWRRDHHLLRAAVTTMEPDLVAGDFNATRDHPPMRMLADAGYRSATELANEGWQPTWPSSAGGVSLLGIPVPDVVQIDDVLVGPTYAAVSTHTVEIPESDHRALVAEVAAK
jgi:endonuclease/exonuclease/phosphatase (EEP) superfamily protein YafD